MKDHLKQSAGAMAYICRGGEIMATSQSAVNRYRAKNYYTFSVSAPVEYREAIKAASAARGVSVSRLVLDALGRELGLDLALPGEFKGGSQAGADRSQGKSTPAETGEK